MGKWGISMANRGTDKRHDEKVGTGRVYIVRTSLILEVLAKAKTVGVL